MTKVRRQRTDSSPNEPASSSTNINDTALSPTPSTTSRVRSRSVKGRPNVSERGATTSEAATSNAGYGSVHNSVATDDLMNHLNNGRASDRTPRVRRSASNKPTKELIAALENAPYEKKKLYTFNELPPHLRDNQFILTHYRAHYTSAECVRSLFEIHNELGNIWTHVIGFFIFLALTLWVLIDIVQPGAAAVHYIVFTILGIGSMGCMICSSTFHTMIPIEDLGKFKKFHAMDYLGITLLIIASFVPCSYYVFVCQPALQWGYIIMICVIGSAGIITPLLPCFEEDFFFWPRLGIYVSIVCSGLVPTVHTCFATPLNHTTTPIYVGVLLMFLLYGTGVIVYASRFPERFAPGRFDLILQSHQIWHIFVLAAAVVHFFNCVALYQNWAIMQGQC